MHIMPVSGIEAEIATWAVVLELTKNGDFSWYKTVINV